MDSGSYWKKRFAALEDMEYQKSKEYIQDVEKQFREASFKIQQDIEKWYYRLADNNGISYAAAKKLLKADSLAEFKWDVDTYIKYGKENNINEKWVKELENASAKVHINYLKAMKIQVQHEAEKLYKEFHEGVEGFIKNSYKDSFYKCAFEVAKGTGVGHNLAALDERRIEKVIKKPWARDGINFSSRIWNNKNRLVETLHTELTQCIIRGQNPDEGAKALAKKMDVNLSQARRLVYTESAAVAAAAQKDCFNMLGVEEYQVVATLDSHTSKICQDMDGKHFPMPDYQPGTTAPPFHCNCRSTTCPYFDDEFTKGEKRAERGADGKTSYVPADMTYKQWQQKFVDGEKNGLQEDVPDVKIKMTDDERLALNKYLSSESYVLNDKLRRGLELSADERKWADNLDALLDKMPEYHGTLYRSVSDFNIGNVEAFINSHVVGEPKIFDSYISSSEFIYDESFPIQYVIQSKYGKDIRLYSQEHEILFKRNSRFLVTKVDGNIIYMEEL